MEEEISGGSSQRERENPKTVTYLKTKKREAIKNGSHKCRADFHLSHLAKSEGKGYVINLGFFSQANHSGFENLNLLFWRN